MPWPSYVWDIFNTVDETTTKEWEYYAPYNILLNYLFPATERFYVSPQHQGLVVPGSIDFSVIYVVHRNKTPIFFLEIKPHSHLNKESTRQATDQQMRGRVGPLFDTRTIPKLYGISALGTKLSIYEFMHATDAVTPHNIPEDPDFVTDVAPKDWWSYELFEEEGEAKVCEIATEMRGMLSNDPFCES